MMCPWLAVLSYVSFRKYKMKLDEGYFHFLSEILIRVDIVIYTISLP